MRERDRETERKGKQAFAAFILAFKRKRFVGIFIDAPPKKP